MKFKTVKRALTSAAIVGLVGTMGLGAMPALAEYPKKPIRMIVGLAAGGGTDSLARSIASFIHEEIGMPGVVINKTGAASMIALKFVMSQKPDGYTLFFQTGTTGLVQYLRGKSPANPFKDLKIIGVIGTLKAALCVPKDSPFKTAKQVVDHAKKHPGTLRWGHPERGSTHNTAGNAFHAANDMDVKDVPTRGGSRARGLLVSKQVDYGFIGVHLLTGFTSKIRCLGITTSERDGVMKSIPTFKELGLKFKDITTPMMLMAHKDLSDAKYQKLVVAVKNLSKKKGFKKFVKKSGLAVKYSSPKDGFDYYAQLCRDVKPVVDKLFKPKNPQSCP